MLSLHIPDFEKLTWVVFDYSHSRHSALHGVHHWQCVAWTGYHLMQEVPDCDPVVVLLFGLLHDSMRLTDLGDPEHGKRGGQFARWLFDKGHLEGISSTQLDLLQIACTDHSDGYTSKDPTIGVCWDADRLNLWRIGIRPSSALMSTDAAKKDSRIQWARKLQSQRFEWKTISKEFSRLL